MSTISLLYRSVTETESTHGHSILNFLQFCASQNTILPIFSNQLTI